MARSSRLPQVLALDGVVLIAKDFDRQLAFYHDLLGLPVKNRLPDAAFLRAGDQTLGIFARSHHPEATARLGGAEHGISHLEFGLDRSFREEVFARLDEAGARAYRENFADADGNLFHFVWR